MYFERIRHDNACRPYNFILREPPGDSQEETSAVRSLYSPLLSRKSKDARMMLKEAPNREKLVHRRISK